MKLLVATDFSQGSAHAAALALRLARPEDIVVVHAAFPPTAIAASSWAAMPMGPAVVPTLEVEPLKARLGSWCDEHGLAASLRAVAIGTPAAIVAEEATRHGVQAVLVGATGASAIERVLLGSNAGDIVGHAPCDAYVVRAPREGPIVVATDFTAHARVAAEKARAHAERTGSRVILAHVTDAGPAAAFEVDDPVGALTQLDREVFGGNAQEVMLRGRPSTEVAQLCEREGASMAVVGSHGARALERILLGSTARHLLEKAPCTVLVVKKA